MFGIYNETLYSHKREILIPATIWTVFRCAVKVKLLGHQRTNIVKIQLLVTYRIGKSMREGRLLRGRKTGSGRKQRVKFWLMGTILEDKNFLKTMSVVK